MKVLLVLMTEKFGTKIGKNAATTAGPGMREKAVYRCPKVGDVNESCGQYVD